MDFTLKTKFNATTKEIYTAWLNSEAHTKMTGGVAMVSNKIGDRFTAWDGYIQGKNILLDPYRRIIQSWRTFDFKKEEGDSKIEVLFMETAGVTELTLIHTNLPESGEQYKKGWDDHYFKPMKAYFSK